MDIFNAICAAVAFIGGAVAGVTKVYAEYQGEIDKIVLRVEKDSQEGWTSEKKELLAVDIYVGTVKPRLSPKIKAVLAFVPDNWEYATVRKLIRAICKKSSDLKAHIDKDNG